MNIAQNIINNINDFLLNEKASIDWNNYLTSEEVDKFLSKDDKNESAEEIVYNTRGNFYNKYFQHFKDEGWTKRELTSDLADFYYNGHLNESITTINPIIMPIKLFKYYIDNNQIKNLDNAKVIASTSSDEQLLNIDDNNKLILNYDDNLNSFNDDMSNKVVSFINTCNSNDDIYILCDAGESRSTAIAAALLMKYDGNDDSIWNNPKYNPNPHVYKTMLNALGIEISDEELNNKIENNNNVLHNTIQSSRHITESIDKLWKSQIDAKTKEDLENYIIRLYKQLENYDEKDIKSNGYYELLDKIEYIESKLGNKPKLGYELH